MSFVDPAAFPQFTPFTKTWHTAPYPFISPGRPALSAAGRHVVVTGGGTGIGLAIAVAFAQAGAASVTIISRRLAALQSGAATISAAAGAGTQVLFEQADLASRDATAAAFGAVAARVGGTIDVLVSNAGGGADGGPSVGAVADASDEHLLGSWTGLVMTAAHAVQAWLPVAGPEAVLLSSNTCFAHWRAVPGFGLYSVARAALLKLTDYVQYENPRVRVVSVQPGWVATEGNGFQKEAPDVGTSSLPLPLLFAAAGRSGVAGIQTDGS